MKEHEISFVVWREGKYFVSRCLNVEVSSFGESHDEAVSNLVEAVELLLEDTAVEFTRIEDLVSGRELVHA